MIHLTSNMPQADTCGNVVSQTGNSTGNLGFQSKYYDTESGMNYYYYRYYKPEIGRFLNEDPIGLAGGLNMYAFVGNDPVSYTDQYGLDRITDNNKVKNQICCLLKSSSVIDDNGSIDWSKFGTEDAFVVYEHSNGMFKTESGTTRQRTKSSVEKSFPRSGGGWKSGAYVHTHPPSKDPWPSSYDNKQAKKIGNPKINTYTVSDKGIFRYPERRPLGNSENIAIWCKENFSKWKDCCKK